MMKFKKAAMYILLTLTILLALMGIPVTPPRRVEMDKDDKMKTEIPEASEKT